MEVSASHQLNLTYESKCKHIHGHNWHITVFCRSEKLNINGMVEDFGAIKEKIHGFLDHGMLNELVDFNPTAENIAHWITEQIPTCYKAEVQETEGNIASYERPFTLAETSENQHKSSSLTEELVSYTQWLNKRVSYQEKIDEQQLISTYIKEKNEKI
jgi:6-pyruvoyltetrahydropterin/6-carboxytetrahydropterin synthase